MFFKKIRKKLSVYSILIKNGYKSHATYSFSMLLGLVNSLTFFFIQTLIWKALLKDGARFDVDFTQMLSYLIITNIITGLLNTNAGQEITQRVNDGSIEIDLVRPAGIKPLIYFDNTGVNLFNTLIKLPVFVIFIAVYGLVLPEDPLMFLGLLISILNGAFMLFYYRYILGLLSFWLIRNPFVEWYFGTFESIFSGSILPIWFYPAWLAALTHFLPFRYFVFEPISIFLGKTPVSEFWKLLLIQALWMGVLYALERFLWSRAHKKLVIQGG